MGRRARKIYYFDVIHDYPAIGGVVEFSQVLQAQLQRRYGERLVSAREALRRYGLADPGGSYLERERHIAQALAERDPGAVFFFPNFHSPIQRPAKGLQPAIINVVHDVQFAHLPELFSGAQLEWLHRAFAATCERADEIVFASRTTRDQFMMQFGAPRRHRVVYHPVQGLGDEPLAGCAGSAMSPGMGAAAMDVQPSDAAATDAVSFLLTATHSDYHPHKNMAGLLRLFAGLAQGAPALQLYVTGHGREKFLQVLQAALPQALHSRVQHLGYVPRAELERLYTRARAYVSLSRFEGFNMPAAEAASRGTPLILSDLPVHRELYAGQACLVDVQEPNVETAAQFLRLAAQTGPQARQSRVLAWPYRARCTPEHVGVEYAAVIEACGASRRTRPSLDAAAIVRPEAGSAPWRSGAAAAQSPRKLARAIREVFAAGAVFTGVMALALPVPAWADGGNGGAGVSYDYGIASGGSGGSGYAGQTGEAGQVDGISYYAGGGGGGSAGGGSGGAGGAGEFGIGGVGGRGGNHGLVAPSISNSDVLQGEDGWSGGTSVAADPPLPAFGGGGGGGAGGYGVVITGATDNTNTGSIFGGSGGAGGAADEASGGSGGDGGVGILFTVGGGTLTNTSLDGIVGGAGGNGGATHIITDTGLGIGSDISGAGGEGGAGGAAVDGSGLAIINSGTITGGNGGAGGAAAVNLGLSASAAAGNGGVGGAGITGSNLTITNIGTITGGYGGVGGAGDSNGAIAGTAGAGGAGIIGSNLAIVNSGTITGGMSGDSVSVQADAIQFTGGTNTLELRAGGYINGVVDATAGDHNTLILGGDYDNVFDASSIGDTVQYRGFDSFEKTGASTWRLFGSTSAVTPWTLSGGTLFIGEDGGDASLGDTSGGLTFNGGTLETWQGFATSRAITLAGPGTIQADFHSVSPLELDGLISGPGSLTLTGQGSIVLNHANTYQGGTNVYTDVDVRTTGALGTGAVAVLGGVDGGIEDDPTLTFENGSSAGNLSITNSVGGQTGFGDTTTAGSATITNVEGGLTAFYDTANAGTASITNLNVGATIFAENADAGSATITNQAWGALLIMDNATAKGATVVNQAGGFVDISHTNTGTSIGSLSGAGNVYLGGKQLTLGALGNNDTISGVISDGSLIDDMGNLLEIVGDSTGSSPVKAGTGTGGSLLKVGAGTLILNGVNTYTGGTTVSGGTLEIGDADHSSASILGDVQVDAPGTLRGHGSIAGNVNNTGLVWPGGSIGTLTIGGNYTQSPGGTLQIEISPTAVSQLKVGGTATLAGTLNLLYAPGTYTSKTYTLLSANSVNGTFSTVKGNMPAGVAQSVVYSADTVDLGVTASVVTPTQATIFGAMGSSALRAGQGANEVLLDRLAGPCGVAANTASRAAAAGGSATGGQGAGAASSGSAAQSLSCPRQGNGLWIQAQGTDTRIDGNHGAPDSRDRRYGFLTGVDHQWKGWTVGVAGGYSHADVTESGNGSKGTLDTLRLAGYGAKNLGAYTLAGTLGYAYDFSSTTRSFGALGSAKGDGHGQEFTAGLQASRPWSLGPVVLTPRLGVRYAYLDGLSTDESGPTAQNLGVANQHLQSLQPYVGVTLDYPFTLRNSDRPASVQLRAGYAYETQSTGRNVSVTAADGTGFVIAGTRDTRGLVTAGLGATLPVGKSTSAYVRYDSVLHTGNVNAQSLQAGVDYRF